MAKRYEIILRKVTSKEEEQNFEKTVEKAVMNGWQLAGGVAVAVMNEKTVLLSQAIWK